MKLLNSDKSRTSAVPVSATLFCFMAVPSSVYYPILLRGSRKRYPIHIIERFREEARRRRRPRLQAAKTALVTMGPHILASMLTTVVGFGAACVLALPLTVSFGLLTAGAIGLVYLASIFVLPTLLARFGGPPVQSDQKLSWP